MVVEPDASEKYIPSIKRAIYLTGQIGQETLDKLTPEILRLQSESAAPITVYIDSFGGSVFHAGVLRDLLRARTLDGVKREFVAVVTSVAGSAAADFLALSDYSLAYSHSRVLYHGTRRSESELTHERALSLALSLKKTNERFARDLAERTFNRLILRLLLFKEEFDAYRASPRDAGLTALANKIGNNLTSAARSVLNAALVKQRRVTSLSLSMDRHFPRRKTPLNSSEFEVAILQAIAKSHLSRHKKEPWLLTEGGLEEITADFHLICDFYFGDDMRHSERWARRFFPYFLSDEQRTELDAINADDAPNRQKYLEQHVGPQIRPLWYLTVSIARILQSDDHNLSPKDAYWLGLVDEVIGSGLPNMRTLLAAGAVETSHS